MKCKGCEEESESEVCDSCIDQDRSEPSATLYYNGDKEDSRTIGEYHNDAEGDFTVKYVRTDGWRGYYELVPSKEWAEIVDDCILSYSQDAEKLHEMQEILQAYLRKKEIKYVLGFARTSNVFSTGYQVFVEKKQLKHVTQVVEALKTEFRDNYRFATTALSGADEKDWTASDKLLPVIAALLRKQKAKVSK